MLVLVAELRDLQEGVDAVALEAVQLEAPGPVLGVDAAQRQAHAEAQARGPHREGRERAGAAVVVVVVVVPAARVRAARVSVGDQVLQVREVAVDLRPLERGGHGRDLAEVLEPLVRRRGAPPEGPEVREYVARDAAAAVRDADDDVLLRLAERDLDGRGLLAVPLGVLAVVLDHGLHGVPQQLADDVLEVAEDVGEGHLQVSVNADLGDRGIGAVGGARHVLRGASAALDNVPGHASEEYLPDELLGLGQLRARREPVRVERLC